MRWSFDDTICTELVNSFIVTATGFRSPLPATTFPSSLIFLYDLRCLLIRKVQFLSCFFSFSSLALARLRLKPKPSCKQHTMIITFIFNSDSSSIYYTSSSYATSFSCFSKARPKGMKHVRAIIISLLLLNIFNIFSKASSYSGISRMRI